MKKIVLLRSNPKDATLERIAHALGDDYDVECLIWDRQGDFSPAAAHPRVAYRALRLRAGYYSPKTLCKVLVFQAWLFFRLVAGRYDCIHAIDLDTGMVGLLVSALRGKPLVYHCLDPYAAALPPSWPSLFGRIAAKAENCVIGHADLFIITDMLRMAQHGGARPRRVVEIANVPRIGAQGPAGGDQTPFTVGYVGSLVDGRNLETIVAAAGSLADRGVRLVLGGFGPLEQELRRSCRRYENVEFTGWLPYGKVLEIERGFDVLLHITDKKNPAQRWVSPNKLFESMALGKPIITGEGTLAAERVARIGNGMAVPYGEREELQNAILYLQRNPGVRKDMGERGRKEFEKNWTSDVMTKRLLDAYRGLFRTGGSPGPV
jgi:glycosyltransferase involved in cell wall biosynthesis